MSYVGVSENIFDFQPINHQITCCLLIMASLFPTDDGADTMIGVLLDVSGSMREAYAINPRHDARVERTHAIFTTLINIVKKDVDRHGCNDKIFVCAFGLNEKNIGTLLDEENTETVTCDFLNFLEKYNDYVRQRDSIIDPYKEMIKMAKEHGVEDKVIPWAREIRETISCEDLRAICLALQKDTTLVHKISDLIPSRPERVEMRTRKTVLHVDTAITFVGSFFGFHSNLSGKLDHGINYCTSASAKVTKAYKAAQEILKSEVGNVFKNMKEPLCTKPVEYVSTMIDNLLSSMRSPEESLFGMRSPEQSLQANIQKYIKVLEPYIYGRTPMCKALSNALDVFKAHLIPNQKKVLFILSDGLATDGDPRSIAKEVRSIGIVIVTCFLTSEDIVDTKKLHDKSRCPFIDKGRKWLFEMSSTLENSQTPICYLVDEGWKLPVSGESCLFFQANSLELVNKICETIVSQLTKGCDALVDIIGRVDLATLINQEKAQFKAKLQEGPTCYANAVAAVFYLAMHRIVGRRDGYPNFYEIRENIIKEYGKKEANTEEVLKNVSGKYRLHFKEVDECGARNAINRRRPVVARFSLNKEEWEKFSEFYKHTPKGTLTAKDIKVKTQTKVVGHAVVLMRCSPKGLTFMNSWGQNWGNGGFFSVENSSVLPHMKFYDVYWFESDLYDSEKEAYQRSLREKVTTRFPTAMKLPYKCPQCKRISSIGEYSGHFLQATCPKCGHTFKPTNEQLMQSLYIKSHNK